MNAIPSPPPNISNEQYGEYLKRYDKFLELYERSVEQQFVYNQHVANNISTFQRQIESQRRAAKYGLIIVAVMLVGVGLLVTVSQIINHWS
jgi:cytoskeletal protein RodZ